MVTGGQPVPLSPDGTLFFSLVILLLMLVSVIGVIIKSKFRMTKGLGLAMFLPLPHLCYPRSPTGLRRYQAVMDPG